MRRFLVLIIAVSLTSIARAQPSEVSRVLRTFDFEERSLGNAEDLPMRWSKVLGSGLPHYVNGRLSTDRARSGKYSFRFDLNGGSLIYRYDAGQILVQPGAHYRVEGFVQTTPMQNARARISAYFSDQDGGVMPDTVRHSQLFVSKAGDPTWVPISVELSAPLDNEDRSKPAPVATSLVIELELVQPSIYAPPSLGRRSLFVQDIHGAAWFDDLAISQVPKVSLSTDRPGNVFRRSDPLTLRVLVNDRFTDDLAAKLVITNASGTPVYQRSGALEMASAQTLGPGRKRLMLELPRLPAGWYEARLHMSSHGADLGQQHIHLVLLADDGEATWPDRRFGIVATDLPFDGWDDLPELLSLVSAGRVKLGVWSQAGDVQQVDSEGFDRLLERLSAYGIEPTACLVSVPPQTASRFAPPTDELDLVDAGSREPDWVRLVKADPKLWQPSLAYIVARHANHLRHWQLGADGSDDFVNYPAMRDAYARIYQEFAALVEQPDLAMPWPAWYELSGALPATIALHVKPEVLPVQVPLYIQDIQRTAGNSRTELSLFLEPLPSERYSREVRIRDLAQRMIYALSADARRIDVRLPFAVEQVMSDDGDERSLVKQPDEMLLIVRTLMSMLSGATFKGKVPIADGVEAFLFDRQGRGVLVMWDRGTTGSVKQLAVNLGEAPSRVDLWGNASPLIHDSSARADGSGNVQLEVGPTPMFLVGIDGQLAQFRASVALDNPLLESSFKPHARKIRFSNPYRQAISGSVRFMPPAGWAVNPPSMTYSLNPGEVFERDITLEFPYNSFAGQKSIDAQFLVQADNNSAITVPILLKLGLSDVGLQTMALRDGDDVIVQQMITNYGDVPIDYTAFALFPGKARQERLVTGLGPGRTTIKKYRFSDVKITPDTKVRSGLRELDGVRILNDEVAIQ